LQDGFYPQVSVLIEVDGETWFNAVVQTNLLIGHAASICRPFSMPQANIHVQAGQGSLVRVLVLDQGRFVGVNASSPSVLDLRQQATPFGYD
jgi:hypothetical protein